MDAGYSVHAFGHELWLGSDGALRQHVSHKDEQVNQLATIAAQAATRNLQFVLAGGHAVITHGFPRSTFDLDLIVRRTDRQKWTELARDLGYEFHSEGATFLQFNAPNAASFPLDLMLVNENTFSKLSGDAVRAPSKVGAVRVVSLLHLLALKCHAVKHGHAGRIVKDADDIIRLIQNNGLDVNAETMRELFARHGTEELYEKIRKACGSNR